MGRKTGVLIVVAWLTCLAPATAAPTGGEDARTPTVAVQRLNLPDTGLRDDAAIMLVGVALIGLAAAVRRAA